MVGETAAPVYGSRTPTRRAQRDVDPATEAQMPADLIVRGVSHPPDGGLPVTLPCRIPFVLMDCLEP